MGTFFYSLGFIRRNKIGQKNQRYEINSETKRLHGYDRLSPGMFADNKEEIIDIINGFDIDK
jgi:hypothetical protein